MNKWKKLVAKGITVLMCTMMSMPVLAAGEWKNPVFHGEHEESEYAMVEMGVYPQKELTGSALTADVMNASYDSKGNASVNGVKIKRLSKEEVTEEIGYVFSEDWKDSQYKYFKYEPIQWRVLNYDGKELLLLSEKILDYQSYNNKQLASWDDSALKKWLNTDFVNQAFEQKEQSKLVGNTDEKVSLLTVNDVVKTEYGFPESKTVSAPSRKATATGYAAKRGIYIETETFGRKNSAWYLKDFISEGAIFYANSVDPFGQIEESKWPWSNNPFNAAGVRPVIRVAVDIPMTNSIYLSSRFMNMQATQKQKIKLVSPVVGDCIIKAESSKTTVASVTNSGTVTALRRGIADITVLTKSGRTLECMVQVSYPKTDLNVDEAVIQVGQKTTAIKLSKKLSTDSVKKWTSSNKKVATVDKNGKITGKKKGKTYITVTMKSGAKAICYLTVQKGSVKTTKLQVNKTKLTLVLSGNPKTFQIKTTKTPVTTQDKVTYKTSNKKVAVVNSKGKITAKKAGKTTITIKCGKKSKKITVTVKKK